MQKCLGTTKSVYQGCIKLSLPLWKSKNVKFVKPLKDSSKLLNYCSNHRPMADSTNMITRVCKNICWIFMCPQHSESYKSSTVKDIGCNKSWACWEQEAKTGKDKAEGKGKTHKVEVYRLEHI